jgi:hypothetical protein
MPGVHTSNHPAAGKSATYFSGPDGAPSRGVFEAHVIFTTWAGTEAALERLGQWADGLDAKITLWSFQVVPRQFSWSSPPVSVDFSEERLRSLAHSCCAGAEIGVRICLCTDRQDCLLNVLRPGSLILLGGRSRWWQTPEQKLAGVLQCCRHRVLFVDTGARTPVARRAAA